MLKKLSGLGSEGLAIVGVGAAFLIGGWLTYLFTLLMVREVALFLGASITTVGFISAIWFALYMTKRFDLPYSTDEY